MFLLTRKCLSIVWLGAAVFTAGFCGPLFAEVKISPVVEVEQEYTDNYFRSDTNRQEAYVTRLGAGVTLDASTDRSRLTLDYMANGYLHTGDSNDDQDLSDQNYLGHNFNLYAATTLWTRLLVGIEDEFFLTREPASSDRFSTAITRDEYWLNRVMPFVTYSIGEKGDIKFAYRYEYVDWLDDANTQDSDENRFILTGTYHMNEANHLDLEGQYWDRSYEDDLNSYESRQVRLIYRHDFNDLLFGEVGAGYHWRTFDDDPSGDWDGAVYLVRLTGKSDQSTVFLQYERNLNDLVQYNGYSTNDKIDAYGERLIAEMIPIRGGGFYQWSNGEEDAGGGHLWGVNVGIGYRFFHDRMECGLSYGYTDYSPDDSPGYEENRVSLYWRGRFGPTEEEE